MVNRQFKEYLKQMLAVAEQYGDNVPVMGLSEDDGLKSLDHVILYGANEEGNDVDEGDEIALLVLNVGMS